MNLELYIARRLLKGDGAKAVSVPIVRIALAGIALGVCVMLLSIFIILGFKQEITNKLSGFAAHLNIVSYETGNSFGGGDIRANDTLLADIGRIAGVKDVYAYVDKPAILKSKDEIHGVQLRGMGTSFSAAFFKDHLTAGVYPDFNTPDVSNEILLSSSVAALLNVKVGDRVFGNFVQDPPRVRVFILAGIYDTGFKEYDDVVALCDIRHLQRLNGWDSTQVSGVGVELDDMEETALVEGKIGALLPVDEEHGLYKIVTLKEMAPQVFDWLSLLNMNVWVILVLIVIVAVFNMVSGLLILILDKTTLIGTLKALGYKDAKLGKLFLYISLGLTGRGMLVGNILALVLGWLQYRFQLISLDPASYYMDTVPVCFDFFYLVLLNAGVLAVSVLMLVVPTMLISRIRPIDAIRFE